MADCACGCGQEIKPQRHHRWRPVRYIHGHGNKGKTISSRKGGLILKGGYVFRRAPGHYLANSKGYAPEHRLVWERANGRQLLPEEHIHHADGNRRNNDPTNLVLVSPSEHSKIHADNPDQQAKRLTVMKQLWQVPEFKARHSKAVREAYRNRGPMPKQEQENRSNGAKQRWADPAKREALITALCAGRRRHRGEIA